MLKSSREKYLIFFLLAIFFATLGFYHCSWKNKTGIVKEAQADTIEANDFVSKIRLSVGTGASQGDYNALTTWETAIQSDLTSAASKIFTVSSRGTYDYSQDDGKLITFSGGGTGTLKHINTENRAYITNVSGSVNAGTVSVNGHSFTISDTGVQIGRMIAECYNDWPQGVEADLEIKDWTTDADHYIKIYAPIGQRHNGIQYNSGFWIKETTGWDAGIDIVVPYTQISGLGFYPMNQGSEGILMQANYIKVDSCLFKDDNKSYSSKGIDMAARTNFLVTNCVAQGLSIGFAASGYNTNGKILNGAASDCDTGFKQNANADRTTLINCMAFNNTSNWSTASNWNASSANNASNDSSSSAIPGTNSITNISSADFLNYAAGDLHLSSQSKLKDAGADLSSIFSTDIDGDTRAGAWDIGPDESSGSSPALSDTEAPSVPTNLRSTNISSNQITLTWDASTDNIGVSGYEIYRNTSFLSTSPNNTYIDSGLNSQTSYFYQVLAFDAAGNKSNKSTSINITTLSQTGTNNPPVLASIGNKTAIEGAALTFTISATDADNDTLTYSAQNLPSGSSFNASTKTFSWTPALGQKGSYSNIQFNVSDGKATDSETISITVSEAQTGISVEKILDNGDASSHIDLAIIGSGFTSAELATYKTKVDQNVAKMFTVNWFKDKKSLFNIWRVNAASPQSGKDLDDATIYSSATGAPYDILIVIHNYDGQESVAKSYVELFKFSDGYVVLAHELGHKIGRLDDEYWTQAMAYKCDGLSKRTLNTHDRASNEKWSDLIPTAPFEGGRYCDKGIWRPSENSIMRDSANSTYFDAVGYKAMDLGAGKILGTTESAAPSLSISGVIDNETKKGTFTAQAVTSDISGIERVEFYWAKAGETSKSIKIDKTAPYDLEIDTTKYEDGQYYLDTLSYDKNWNYSRLTKVFNISNGSGSSGLNVPIIVQEALTQDTAYYIKTSKRQNMPGLDRTNEPITVGIPLTENSGITNVNQLGLSGVSLQQFRPLDYWPNGNIKWVLADTQINLSANSNSTIFLVPGAGNSSGNLAADNGGDITVNTGIAQFKIKKKNFNLFESVIVNGKELVSGNNAGGLSMVGYEDRIYKLNGVTHTLKKGQVYDSKNDSDSTSVIEENGPAKTIVKSTGAFKDSDGNRLLDYTIRFYFYKDKSYVKTDVILRHGQEEIHANDYPNYYNQMPRVFSDMELDVPLNLGDGKQFSFAGKENIISGAINGSAYMYQPFSMAHRKASTENDRNDGTTGWANPPMERTAGDKATGYIQKGLEIKNGGNVLNALGNENDWTRGFAEIKDQSGSGLSIAMQYMSSYWPASIEFNDQGNAEIGIFSKYNSKKDIKIGWATHETRQMIFDFHTAPIDNTQVIYRLEQPVVGRTTLDQYMQSKALFGEEKLVSAEEMDKWFLTNYGPPIYGIPVDQWVHSNSGILAWRTYWYSGVEGVDWPQNYSYTFLKTGMGGRYMSALQKVIFNSDSSIRRTDGFDYSQSKVKTDYRYSIVETGAYNAGGGLNHFDYYGHTHWRAMILYYYLTGNEEIKDAIGDYMEEYLKNASTPTSLDGLAQDLRGYSRYIATVALGYEFTKNEKLKKTLEDLTKHIVDSRDNPQDKNVRGRNLERGYLYFGIPTEHINTQYVKSFQTESIHADDAGHALRVLKTYDKSYPLIEDFEDYLLGLAQFDYQELYMENPNKTDFGCFSNYILHSPNPWVDYVGDYTMGSAIYMHKPDASRAMVMAYTKTGDSKYLERGKKLLAFGGGYGGSTPYPAQELIYIDLHGVAGVWQYVNNVQATNNGANKYTLSWKVPEGASAYQIKFSDKPIVDWLGFDQMARTYQYDPASNTAFFAAWNIDNEPAPLANGLTQTFAMDIPQIITQYNSSRNLSSGNPSYITYDANKTYYFSIKYYSPSTGGTSYEDTSPPSGSVIINNNSEYASSTIVTLNLNASDQSGVLEMKVSNTNDPNSVSAEQYKSTKGWLLATGDGTKKVYVWFKDGAGNWNSAPYQDSITLDTTAANILNIAEENILTGSSNLKWDTSEDTSGQVEYGLTNLYGNKSNLDNNFSKSHNISLGNLSANATYHYRVVSRDKAGNSSFSIDRTFKTQAAAVKDTTPPDMISDLGLVKAEETSVEISWTAVGDDKTQGQAKEYDLRYIEGSLAEISWSSAIEVSGEPVPKPAGQKENMIIVGLKPGKTYSFGLKVKDAAENISSLSNILDVKTKTETKSGGDNNGGNNNGGNNGGSTGGENSGGGSNNGSNADNGSSTSGGSAGGGQSNSGTFQDITPPEAPSLFKAVPAEKQILLTWRNPQESDFVRVVIIRKQGAAPKSKEDGQVIYEGNGQEYTDIGLENTKEYYYGIFSYDKKPNYSQMAIISSKPQAGKNTLENPKQEEKPKKLFSDIKSLFGQPKEITEYVSQSEGAEIYEHNKQVPLNDTGKNLYLKIAALGKNLSIRTKYAIAAFIHYGTDTTQRLGAGERAGVIGSYQQAFNKLPQTEGEWQDVIKIANGRWPNEKNAKKEKETQEKIFTKIYKRMPNMANANDNAAVTVITYGLRPVSRNMASEKNGIKTFKGIYEHNPVAAAEWDIARAIAYSGATR